MTPTVRRDRCAPANDAERRQRPGEDWARAARGSSRHLQARAVHRRGSGDLPLVAGGSFTVYSVRQPETGLSAARQVADFQYLQ